MDAVVPTAEQLDRLRAVSVADIDAALQRLLTVEPALRAVGRRPGSELT